MRHSLAPRKRVFAMAGLMSLVGTAVALIALVAWLTLGDAAPIDPGLTAQAASAAAIERGAYLARAGNCRACHTVAGGAAFAGGVRIDTPFGAVVAPNITPDLRTGIGPWSAADFWRALHHGRGKNGRLLNPAFPYPSFTYVTREDSDALYAYLRSVPAVERPNDPSALRFPFNTQAALALWRALYFRPGELRPQPGQSTEWNRGRYLVLGLGHCSACHSERDALGGIHAEAEFAGGLMPDSKWYAPSLSSPGEAGVQAWPRNRVARLLKVGAADGATASGPMAEVVYASTQHLDDADLEAIASYLAWIPARDTERHDENQRASSDVMLRGGNVYSTHCAACHGKQGKGIDGIYPALAGNRAVTLARPNNLVQIIRHGGFAPTTAGNPRPFGMPPLGQVLDDDEIAAVSTFIRQSWGNSANPVTPLQVLHVR